ncbi:MAG TPA: hypothetical protein VEF76_01085 [Patescibacteria group bacterium]|nr:hypothetical protein [Patescibacteria group bacterium]
MTQVEDLITQQLQQLLRQEMAAGIAAAFAGRTQGAGGTSIVIHNNTPATVGVSETGGFDQKQLEITIDQMVANSLVRGRETGGVLRTLFGLVPGLIGR